MTAATDGLAPIRVLCVDDPERADATASHVASVADRFDVATATSVGEALDALDARPFDCVLAAYALPDATGLDLLDEVRDEYSAVPVVLYTDTGSERVASAAISAGVSDYVRRDDVAMQASDLADRITTLVARSREDGGPEAGRLPDDAAEQPRTRPLELVRSRLELALAATDATVWEWDPDTDAVRNYSSPTPVAGTTVETLDDFLAQVHPDDRPRLEGALDAAVDDGVSHDVEVRTAGDDDRWLRDRGQVVEREGDRSPLLVGVRSDVTERKRRERELERANDLFEKAQDIADVGAWDYDVTNDEIHWTDQVYDIHELPYDEDPSPELSIEFYHPEDRDEMRTAFGRAITEREPYDVELRLCTADGDQRWVRTRGTPQMEGEEVVRVRGTIQDITERKEGEEALRRQNERLDQFAAVVSHDLRNPLNVAGAWLDLAREEDDTDHLDGIADAHDRMAELIDDLLAFARNGAPIEDVDAVDLAALPKLCWGNVDTDSATLLVEADATIEADRDRLKSLFENLMRNSVEHGGEAVTVTVGDLAGESGFYVEDDGPGIPPEDREAVFESDYTTGEESTGFGLSIVAEIAEAHGWTVTATESEHGGARFEITGVTVQ